MMEVARSKTSAHSRQRSAHSRKWLFSNTVWGHELQINEIFWYFIPVFVDINRKVITEGIGQLK
jgi:hypothetical protein